MSTTPTRTAAAKKARGGVDRRGELIQIAGQLFAEKGFLATTIRDIADAAGIQSGSLYYHFESKESMVEELIRQYWTTLLERYRAVIDADLDATETARGLIRASVLLLDECELALRLMLNDWNYLSEIFPFMEERLEECRELWLETLDRGVSAGEFSTLVDPLITYRTVMSAVSGTARWFRPGGQLSVETLADEMASVFMAGIIARP
ncbi:TetR/AcrR family transcriptional regulator [Nocardioides terrigena]|uniref:TetR/AcrR family transcriptional regulator n=1 Tax=Nocardioides terrigena TaxID=424797 RepID=UPI00131EEE26|nr:TetR/AcrR family transcriptional regulator [Nocardioides terrigena]